MGSIEGVIVTPLKIIPNAKGDIMHALKESEASFESFGEAYFSTIIKEEIKGWKKHRLMTLNIIVPAGEIKFVLYDDRSDSSTYGNFFSITVGPLSYVRLTVPPLVWMAFKGEGSDLNLLLNIASIEHKPDEAESRTLESFNYKW